MPELICGHCSISFTRAAHLRRHQASHLNSREFQCSFCLTTFSRRDSLRKHWKLCFLRKVTGEPVPDPESRGRKRQACDNCALSKRACSLDVPCSSCVSKGISCSYLRITPSVNMELNHDLAPGSEEPVTLSGCAEAGQSLGHTISRTEEQDFGSNDPGPLLEGRTEMTSIVQADTPSSSILLRWPVSPPQPVWLNAPGTYPQEYNPTSRSQCLGKEKFEFLLNFEIGGGINRVFNFITSIEFSCSADDIDEAFPSLVQEHDDVTNACWSDPAIPSPVIKTVEWLYDPLLPQAKAVWEKLLGISQSAPTGPVFNDQNMADDCIRLFNPKSLRVLLSGYWRNWHHHCPIIHRATLNIVEIPTEMLIVMCLLGAFASPDSAYVDKTQQWLDLTERLIFSLPWLAREKASGQSELPLSRLTKVRYLQTGLLICVLQTWEGTESARLRVRELRYPYLVQASHELEVHESAIDPNLDGFDVQHYWEKFMVEEQLIRTKTFIFLLDTAFTIFHNTPPHVTVSDLKFPFPCPDDCFDVHSKERFITSIQGDKKENQKSRGTLISQAVQVLCNNSSNMSHPLPPITGLNGFILISALHSILFQQEISYMLSPSMNASISQALRKWHSMWEHDMREQQSQSRNPLSLSLHDSAISTGFTRHSHEFYCLALAKLNCLNGLGGSEPAESLNDLGKGNVKSLIYSFRQEIT